MWHILTTWLQPLQLVGHYSSFSHTLSFHCPHLTHPQTSWWISPVPDLLSISGKACELSGLLGAVCLLHSQATTGIAPSEIPTPALARMHVQDLRLHLRTQSPACRFPLLTLSPEGTLLLPSLHYYFSVLAFFFFFWGIKDNCACLTNQDLLSLQTFSASFPVG